MSIEPRRRWRNSTVYSVGVWYQEVWSSSVVIQGLGNQPCSFKYQPNCLKWERFSMSVERSRPSRSSYGQSAWGISTVSFISMLRPICRACEQRLSGSNLTFLSSTRSRPLCLLRFRGPGIGFSGAGSDGRAHAVGQNQ